MLLRHARQEARYIFEGNQRNVEAVAKTDETCSLIGSVYIQHTSQISRLVGYNSYRTTIQTGEANHNILCKMGHHFKEILVIHNRLYYILNVIRNVRVFRNHSLKLFCLTSGIIRTRNKRSILHIIGRQEAEQFAYGQHGFFFSVTHEVSNATLTAMCIGSTQLFLVHFFMRNRFHYIRPCDEHMAFLFHHKNKIRQCR